MKHRTATLASAALLLGATVAGCSGGGASKTPTRAPSAVTTPASTRTATPSLGIRTLDLSAVADVRAVIASTGGSYLQDEVTYADVTGDGIDEAIVPIDSGGTAGDIAFLVLTPSGSGTKTLLNLVPTTGSGGLAMAIEGGQIVITQPVYGPEDPNCCPGALRKTTYVWNGTALAVESVKTETNPVGGGKPTPVVP